MIVSENHWRLYKQPIFYFKKHDGTQQLSQTPQKI